MARDHTSPTVLGGLLALALTPAFWPGGAIAQEEEVACNDKATELVLRKGAAIGDIFVCNDETTLVVTIKTTYPWCLLKTDVHAATIPEDGEADDNIPQTQAWRTPPRAVRGQRYARLCRRVHVAHPPGRDRPRAEHRRHARDRGSCRSRR
jgi:hypothetical protein